MSRIFACHECKKPGQTHALKDGGLHTQIAAAGYLAYCAKCQLEDFDDIPEAAEALQLMKRFNAAWIKLNREVAK